jgi:peptidoglycan/LPS O-acetylase OafA/YrhL
LPLKIESTRNLGLDVLRAFAIILVLLAHLGGSWAAKYQTGLWGVHLFFVLSGYLITTRFLASDSGSWSSYVVFLARRAARILPVYVLCLLLLWMLYPDDMSSRWKDLFFFYANYSPAYQSQELTSFTHFWSLSLEVQFYIIWPLLLLLVPGKPMYRLLLAFSCMLLCYGQFYLDFIPGLTAYRWVGLFPQGFSLFMGAMGAFILKNRTINLKSPVLEWLMAIGLVLTILWGGWWKYIAVPVCYLYWILNGSAASTNPSIFQTILSSRPLAYIGRISYGLYIFHVPIYCTLRSYGSMQGIALSLLTVVLSGLLASFSFHLLEMPVISWSRRRFKQQG